jgi:hypothetical protein
MLHCTRQLLFGWDEELMNVSSCVIMNLNARVSRRKCSVEKLYVERY